MRISFIVILLIFFLTGCEDAEKSQSRCEVVPDTLDYGRILAPPVTPITAVVERTFTIINIGNENLAGTISYGFETELGGAPILQLVSPDSTGIFEFAPGDTAGFSLQLTVYASTRPGDYMGKVTFGSQCPSIRLLARIDPSN